MTAHMREVTLVFNPESLLSVLRASCEQLEPWSIVNTASGDELQIEPDVPVPGLVTVTARQPDGQ